MDSQTIDLPPAAPGDIAPGASPDIRGDGPLAALGALIAAGLVSHEVIGDPGLLGAEAPVLGRICALIGGPLYRIDAFHYAFRAGEADLEGGLGRMARADWTPALASALADALGEEAVWLNAADPLPSGDMAGPEGLEAPLLLLRAQEGAVVAGLQTLAPGTRAVIQARYAAETALLTAHLAFDGAAGTQGLAPLLARLDDQARLLAAQGRMLGEISARLEALMGGLLEGPESARATLGLTLAELLARLESQGAEGALPRPS